MRNGRIEAELKSELEATKGKTGYKIVEGGKGGSGRQFVAGHYSSLSWQDGTGGYVEHLVWSLYAGHEKPSKPLKEELKEVVYLYIVDETSPKENGK
ncbi:hypothetical protein NIB75_22710 [Bacteroides uniformis]|nr:hypothetical protein [Bacteroides uniformis]